MQWQFHGRDREKTLTIEPASFFVEFRRYERYENLRAEFYELIRLLFQEIPEAQPSRLGLRYVNVIDMPGDSPLNWDGIINSNLLAVFNFPPADDKPQLSRVFQNMEFKFDDFNLRFQFGMNNPDYPARIRQKKFILDYDAYFQGAIEQANIETTLNHFHEKIQYYFETSIEDGLRSALNA